MFIVIVTAMVMDRAMQLGKFKLCNIDWKVLSAHGARAILAVMNDLVLLVILVHQ